jgi:hypothetical protein
MNNGVTIGQAAAFAAALVDVTQQLAESIEELAAREGLVLARALVPEGFDEHLGHVGHALQDARFVALSKHAAESAIWEPDAPALPNSPPPWSAAVSSAPHSSSL